jgi:hypothetical protein
MSERHPKGSARIVVDYCLSALSSLAGPRSLPRTYCHSVASWVRLLLAPLTTLESSLNYFRCHGLVFVDCEVDQ